MHSENQVKIGEKSYEVKPVKMKYIQDGFYGRYLCLQNVGLMKTSNFTDGAEAIHSFLTAVFDSEEIAKEASIDMLVTHMNEILVITKRLNEIEDEPEKNLTTPTDKE